MLQEKAEDSGNGSTSSGSGSQVGARTDFAASNNSSLCLSAVHCVHHQLTASASSACKKYKGQEDQAASVGPLIEVTALHSIAFETNQRIEGQKPGVMPWFCGLF